MQDQPFDAVTFKASLVIAFDKTKLRNLDKLSVAPTVENEFATSEKNDLEDHAWLMKILCLPPD